MCIQYYVGISYIFYFFWFLELSANHIVLKCVSNDIIINLSPSPLPKAVLYFIPFIILTDPWSWPENLCLLDFWLNRHSRVTNEHIKVIIYNRAFEEMINDTLIRLIGLIFSFFSSSSLSSPPKLSKLSIALLRPIAFAPPSAALLRRRLAWAGGFFLNRRFNSVNFQKNGLLIFLLQHRFFIMIHFHD